MRRIPLDLRGTTVFHRDQDPARIRAIVWASGVNDRLHILILTELYEMAAKWLRRAQFCVLRYFVFRTAPSGYNVLSIAI
jgi:hypothetical protein